MVNRQPSFVHSKVQVVTNVAEKIEVLGGKTPDWITGLFPNILDARAMTLHLKRGRFSNRRSWINMSNCRSFNWCGPAGWSYRWSKSVVRVGTMIHDPHRPISFICPAQKNRSPTCTSVHSSRGVLFVPLTWREREREGERDSGRATEKEKHRRPCRR